MRPAIHPVIEFDGRRYYRKPSGYYKADHSEGGVYLHRAMWAFHNGTIPGRHHIHHVDHNRENNTPANLELLSAKAHLRYHALLRRGAAPEVLDSYLERAREAARAWHQSDEGRAWHREHAKRMWAGQSKSRFACAHCGEVYEAFAQSVKRGFCSASCQGMARKKSGKDAVDRSCVWCGTTFRVDKYSRVASCSRACGCKVAAAKRNGVWPRSGGVPDVLRRRAAGGEL